MSTHNPQHSYCVDCGRMFKTHSATAAKCPECAAAYNERHAKFARPKVRQLVALGYRLDAGPGSLNYCADIAAQQKRRNDARRERVNRSAAKLRTRSSLGGKL